MNGRRRENTSWLISDDVRKGVLDHLLTGTLKMINLLDVDLIAMKYGRTTREGNLIAAQVRIPTVQIDNLALMFIGPAHVIG